MSELSICRSSKDATCTRRKPRRTGLVLMAVLFMGNCAAAELSGQEVTPAARGLGTTSAGVDDTELNAIYGKGYPEQALHPEIYTSVILWDEGKRKVPTHSSLSGVVMEVHSEASR